MRSWTRRTSIALAVLLLAACQEGNHAADKSAAEQVDHPAFLAADTVFVVGDRRLAFQRTWSDAGVPVISVLAPDGSLVQEMEARLPFDLEPPLSEEDREMLPDFGFEMADFNFDGFGDLQRVRDLGAYNAVYDIWLYNPASGQFDYNEALSELVMPGVDADTRTVSSFAKSGAVYYKLTTFAWEDGQLTPVRVEERDMGDSEADVWPVTVTSLPDGTVICRWEDRLVDDGMIESVLLEGTAQECLSR